MLSANVGANKFQLTTGTDSDCVNGVMVGLTLNTMFLFVTEFDLRLIAESSRAMRRIFVYITNVFVQQILP